MKKIIFLILALAAVFALSAGSYHNPGMKFWAAGTYTITIETTKSLQVVRIIPYDNSIKVVAFPSYDDTRGVANGDTIQIPAGTFMQISMGNANSMQIIRDGGSTSLLAAWGGD